MSDTIDKQKLYFLENLLNTNEQIKLQYHNFMASNEQLEQTIEYLMNCTNDKFKLDIFTTILKCLIYDELQKAKLI